MTRPTERDLEYYVLWEKGPALQDTLDREGAAGWRLHSICRRELPFVKFTDADNGIYTLVFERKK